MFFAFDPVVKLWVKGFNGDGSCTGTKRIILNPSRWWIDILGGFGHPGMSFKAFLISQSVWIKDWLVCAALGAYEALGDIGLLELVGVEYEKIITWWLPPGDMDWHVFLFLPGVGLNVFVQPWSKIAGLFAVHESRRLRDDIYTVRDLGS
jgi:hypothetical protein